MRPASASSAFVVFALAFAGCATGMPRVDPADIPRLQQEVAADPADTDLQVRLGMAQFEAGRYEAARASLSGAIDAGNDSDAAVLYLGLTQEELGSWVEAREAYDQYLTRAPGGPASGEVRSRLQLIARNVLQDQARQALAQETQLTAAAATPRSVAILPFGFNSERADLEPLIYALSDMMITDFAISNALIVLERAQIQTLLDEMSLTEAGYADQATGARAGRLLQAEHVVQGVITPLGQEDLRLDQDVLNVPGATSVGTLDAQDRLTNLFDMEKDLVFRTLRDVLGVDLTPAEEQAILENRSDNVLAFLAYGRGLQERDRGNYASALENFRQAQELDPGFAPASDAANETQEMESAVGTTTSGVSQTAQAGGGAVSPAGGGATSGPVGTGDASGTLNNVAEGVDPNPTAGTLDTGSTTSGNGGGPQSAEEKRDPVQESQGREGVGGGTTAQIRILIKRPGGAQ